MSSSKPNLHPDITSTCKLCPTRSSKHHVSSQNGQHCPRMAHILENRRAVSACLSSLMMKDFDNLKLLNDTQGHTLGNNFPVEVAHTIGQKQTSIDVLYRYGGDEFPVIMPATGLIDAMRIGQRLRESVSEIPWTLERAVSASIGLGEYQPDSKQGASVFINMADRALDKAKKNGKNRICFEAFRKNVPRQRR